MEVGMANEKWILTVRELHLGHCKETFRAGSVIELDEANGRLIIDGRRFNDTRDLDVLKRQSLAHPDNPWVIPYSQDVRAKIIATTAPMAVPQRKILRPDQKLQVVQSDEDLNDPIDISDTKVGQRNAAAKEAARMQRREGGKMEVIRGDETVEERLASLKDKTDIGSIAERARLKASGAVKMAVVKDDSLGAGFTGRSAISLNAGQHLPSREEADAKKGEASVLANVRKKETEVRRQVAPEAPEGSEAPEGESRAEAPAEQAPESGELQELRAENLTLKDRLDRLEKLIVAQQASAPRRGPGRPVKSPAAKPEGEGA